MEQQTPYGNSHSGFDAFHSPHLSTNRVFWSNGKQPLFTWSRPWNIFGHPCPTHFLLHGKNWGCRTLNFRHPCQILGVTCPKCYISNLFPPLVSASSFLETPLWKMNRCQKMYLKSSSPINVGDQSRWIGSSAVQCLQPQVQFNWAKNSYMREKNAKCK